MSVDIITEKNKKALLEAGFKLGIRSNFANLIATGEELFAQDYKTPEGVISAAFKAWQLYINVLKFLANPINAGSWFYLEGTTQKEKTNIKHANPTQIFAETLNITTEQFVMRGTKIHAVNVTIKAKKITATPADNLYDYHKIVKSTDPEISIANTSPIPSLNAAFGKDKVKQVQRLNAKSMSVID